MNVDQKFLNYVLPELNPESRTFIVAILPGGQVRASPDVTVPALAQHAQRLDAPNVGIYFTPFTFAGSSRTQKNAAECRCLYVDLDVGTDKPHASKKEAVTSLQQFCQTTEIPVPNVIVDSGTGVHAYWVFERALPAASWLTVAQPFKEFCLGKGFRIDPAVTADSARVLRLPGSVNYKSGAAPVRVVRMGPRFDSWAQVTDKIAMTQVAAQATPALPPPPTYLQGADAASALGQLGAYKDPTAQEMFDTCPQMAHVLSTNGQSYPEPVWRIAINLLSYCSDGIGFIHTVSNGHPKYTPAGTDAKYHSTIANRKGPITCASLEKAINENQLTPALCSTCPNYQKITSPVVPLGQISAATGMPSGYEVDNGRIYRSAYNEKPRYSICNLFALDVEVYTGADNVTAVLITPQGKSADDPIVLTAEETTDIKTIRNKGSYDLNLTGAKMPHFDTLISSWVNALRQQGQRYVSLPSRVGWSDDWSSFTFANRVLHHKNGTITASDLRGTERVPALTNANPLHRKGDFDVWQKHVQQLIDTGVPEAHPVIAMSFAACLTELMPDATAVAMLISEHSGVGKTTLLRAANSVWFSPIRGLNMDDTGNYINGLVMSSHSLPIFWDEVVVATQQGRFKGKGHDVDDVAAIIFRTIQGMDKGRMNNNATLREKQLNRPLVCLSSNLPLAEMLAASHTIAPAAIAARTVQLTISGRPTGVIHQSPLNQHYGTAGEKFIRFLMRKGQATVEGLLRKVSGHLAVQHKELQDAGRFWRTLFTLTLVAGHLVNESKILKLDMNVMASTLLQAVKDTHGTTVAAASQTEPLSALSVILADAYSRGEVIESEYRPRTRKGSGQITPAISNQIKVWVAPNDAWARVRRSVLRTEMLRQKLQPARAFQELERIRVLTPRKNAIYVPSGPTNANVNRADSYDVDITVLNKLLKQRPN